MKEIKVIIDGKEVRLTDEQLRALGITKENNNPFDRVKGEYYTIKDDGVVYDYTDIQDRYDNTLYNNVNYFNDNAFAQQVHLHQLLYRKLLKFAYDNNYFDTASWNGIVSHWYIGYDYESKQYIGCSDYTVAEANTVYFNSRNAVNSAIEQVVRPFEAKNPDFKWKGF